MACLAAAAIPLGSVNACAGSPQRPSTRSAEPGDAPANGAAATAADATAGESADFRPDAATRQVRISAVGDLILGSTPNVPSDPYSYLAPVRKAIRWKAGVVFANLEGTLTTQTHSKCSGSSSSSNCFAFRNPPSFAHAFRRTGFSVLNDANNHSHDYGQAGLSQTVHSIRRAGMVPTGLPGEICYQKTGGVRVGLVAFAPYRNTADMLDLPTARRMIRKAGRHADLVVVYMHAGAEGSDRQHVTGHEEYYLGEDRGNPEKFAHLAVRAGADLVIASGPHVLRGMEFYRHRLIAYSLGNFANFHNFAGGGVLSDSAILHVTLTASGRYVSGRLVPVQLQDGGRAVPGGNSVSVVRHLSHQDFPATSARFGRRGGITPPR